MNQIFFVQAKFKVQRLLEPNFLKPSTADIFFYLYILHVCLIQLRLYHSASKTELLQNIKKNISIVSVNSYHSILLLILSSLDEVSVGSLEAFRTLNP